MDPLKCKRMLPLLVWTLAFIALGHTLSSTFSISSSFPSGISGARAETAVKRTLVGGLPAFPPFAFPEQDGTATRGLMVQMLQAISRELNLPIDVKCYPYARTLEYLKSGDLDLALLYKNPGLSGNVDYVGKISLSKVVVIARKGLQVQDYEDLYNLKSIAVIRGASFGVRFDKDQKLNKFEVENYRQGILMLESQRVDAVVGSRPGLQYAIDQAGFDNKSWQDPYVLGYKEVWVHFSNQSDQQSIIPALRKAVEKLYRPNLLYELYEQKNNTNGSIY